ncbi:MAG: hypothetical protein AAF242_02820 [Bacteroidota bacterium]
MKKVLFVFLCLYVFGIQAKAQLSSDQPLKISILDESISLPNTWFLDYSFNPAIMVGTEITLKSNPKNAFFLSGDLGFYHHKGIQSALVFNLGLGYRQEIGRLYASLRLGPGYSHIFTASQIYEYENGEYVEKGDLGRPTFSPFIALEVGYALSSKAQRPELFLTMIESVDINAVTFPHQFVGLGLKFYPFQ